MSSERKKVLEVLQTAMLSNPPLRVEFEYMDKAGNITRREVEPYEIQGDNLSCHCTTRDATRKMNLDAITDIRLSSAFSPRYPIVVVA